MHSERWARTVCESWPDSDAGPGNGDNRYIANLVLLNADPLKDIANTRKIDGVVLNGKFLDRAQTRPNP
jgi:hypothetical protein